MLPLKHLKLTPESYTVIAGRPSPPDTDAGLVQGAWDFTAINRAHARVLDLAKEGRQMARSLGTTATQRRRWRTAERSAWWEATRLDPLLPETLCPPGYLGRDAWAARKEAIATVLKLLRAGVQDM